MSKEILTVIAVALLLAPGLGSAAPRGKCPGSLVDLTQRKYQVLGKSARCYAKRSIAESQDLTRDDNLCISGQFKAVATITADGEGPAFTKTFIAGPVHPKVVVSYDTEGDNRFSLTLIHRTDLRAWEKNVGWGPFSDEVTYLDNTIPGEEYYLAAKPSPKTIDKEKQYGNWSLQVFTNPDDF